jgi:sterol desaturase/sphingolipid hydroxylase (fatty acid hydroxylase superfamily)
MTKIAIVAGSILVFFVLGRLFPFAKLTGFGRIYKNFLLAVFNVVMSPLIVIPVSAFAAQYALHWRPVWWDGWFGLALDIVLLDVWIYWWHRANHEIAFLWRFHEVHHLDETLDASSAVRFHFGEVLLSSLARAVFIFLLGVPLNSVLVFETIIAVATIFHHSNLRMPDLFEQALSRVIVTPSIHWVHHHALRRDTDSNYATFLSLWDYIFSSRSATVRSVDMPVGVEGKRDDDLLGLIKRPFPRIGK